MTGAMIDASTSGLPAEAITAIRQALSSHPGIHQAILYGSRAIGTYRPGSGIDLTLKGELSYRDLLKIEAELDDLMLPYKMDLSLYCHLDNTSLVEHIDRVGKIFYAKT